MVEDIALVREAERLTNGADIHKTASIVKMYRAAVKDAQSGNPAAEKTACIFHEGLEEHVRKMRMRKAIRRVK